MPKGKAGAKEKNSRIKAYNASIKTSEKEQQIRFQEAPYFKNKVKEKYKIEVKNAETKQCFEACCQNYQLMNNFSTTIT